MKLLESFHTDPDGKYIDYEGDIVGNEKRGIRFVLTYVVKDDTFYANIADTRELMDVHLDFIDHDVAKFMIGEEEYNKLKEIRREELCGK